MWRLPRSEPGARQGVRGREPASTMVEITKFVHPLAKVEIEAVAI
jgi:enamine deaminase RidA (YjgF/YER057c/UK114 family)